MPFSHLHLHTEYSLLNGMVRIKDMVSKAKDLGMPAVAMTDYGNIFGAVEFFQAAKGAGIKPILGTELFIPSYDDHELKQYKRGQDVYFQFVVIVQNETGYKNLAEMLTRSYLEGFYYKPRVDSKLIQEFSEGLICLSGGFNSEVNHYLMNDDFEKAKEVAKKYAEWFPERFYLELQDNGLAVQQKNNRELSEIGKELGIPLVATGNVHYMERDDAEAFEVQRAVQMGRSVYSPHDHMKFSTDLYEFKTPEQMEELFQDYPEAIENTQKIVDECDFNFTYGVYHLPNYDVPEGMTLDDYLEEQSYKGLDSLWDLIKKVSNVTDEDKKKYQERLQHEINVITKMGFSGYFLIVSDFIKWAKENDIPVGPGRGSGAGSLVAYCLRITDLDPLPYNLLFERFLNPDRVSMPDFDVDFCQDRRGEVIEYVNKKYGNVSQIITFGKMKAKAVIRDVGRVLDLEYEYVDKIAKLIPNALNITLQQALEEEPKLKELYKQEDTVKKLIDTSLRLEGLSRHASVHAAGVIITDKPLWNFAPLYKGSKEDIVVQYDMKCSEKIGLVKFDFLGLKTLTVIYNAVKNVKKSKGIDIDIMAIPMDDKDVYQTLINGDGCGIFQLESQGMRELMKRLQPGCFEDIIALVALYRPGPLGSGMVDDFIERKKGTKEIVYDLPQLEGILKDTYGVIVYQEQVMQISSVLANYSLGEADLLRRAMGKKKAEEMDAQRVRFLQGAEENKIDKEKAEKIFDLMAKFAEYGFNKSHSAAYALVSYQTAYLKTHHYPEFMASIMSSEMEDTDKILLFINDCKAHNCAVLGPNINVSEKNFTVEDGSVRYGLAAIKGVGGAAIDSIVEARKDGPFKSMYDFCSRVDLRRVTKKVVEMLIKAGAFDSFDMPKKGMFQSISQFVDAAVRKQKNESLGQGDLFSSMDAESKTPIGVEIDSQDEWPQTEMLSYEKEAFGFYFSSHPLASYGDTLNKLTTHNTSQLSELAKETTVTLGGVMLSHRVITTKKGDRMAFGVFEDLEGSVELVIFPRAYKVCEEILSGDDPILVKGTVDQSDEGAKILVEGMSKLTETLKSAIRSIRLEIPIQKLSPTLTERMISILKQYQGESHVFVHLKKQNEFETVLEFPETLRVMACEPLKFHLDRLFQGDVVKFH